MPERPQPYEGFQGEVGTTLARSTPWWPAPRVAPDGAPNVLIVLCDDLGYADLGCYGSEISTPEIDRLAAEGLRYTNFHVTPMCSPTRAALLTGLNPHRAGVGHVAQSDPGFPGYAMELTDRAATMAEILRDAGWTTLMVGKWHLSKESHHNEAGDRSSWPCQRGFDRYYGILDAFTNYHQPHRLIEDNHAVDVDGYPPGYYFTDDLTDRAIAMVRGARAGHPSKPWFLYVAHGAVHAPIHAKPDDIDRYRGRYAAGWDAVRDQRFERQQELGVIAPGTRLPPRNHEEDHEVQPWDDLSAGEREVFARHMEVYAAMVDAVDQSFGRLRAALEAMGEWDDTLVIFLSDNGASREGELMGTSAYLRTLTPLVEESFAEDRSRLDLLGGPQTMPAYPRGWAMASCTPFRLYKINTHAGGHSVPFVVRPAAASDEAGGALRHQYQYVTDLLPTVLDVVGVAHPGQHPDSPLLEPQGTSFARSLTDPDAPSTHREQHFEMRGHRGFYRDGWEVVTCHLERTPFSGDRWELYDLTSDPTETRDLAAEHPDRVAELVEAWEQGAWRDQVYPLDEGSGLKYLVRPPWHAELARPVTLVPGMPQLERWRSLQLIDQRSFTVTVALSHQLGRQGTLVAHGDQGGGYGLYLIGDRLRFVHNGYGLMTEVDGGPVPAAACEIELAVEAAGGGVWNATLTIDGEERGDASGLRQLMAMAPFQGIDVGVDRRSPVSWALYERYGTFPYDGTIERVVIAPGELAPDAGARWLDAIRESALRYD